jgi:hypothetical protein
MDAGRRELAEKIATLLVESDLKAREFEKVLDLAHNVAKHHREFGDGVRLDERRFQSRDAQV